MFNLQDMTLELDAGSNVKYTTDGYMTAVPRVARTGIQLYRGSELGVKDKPIVRIFRDENQVFNKASLSSFSGKPFTDDHPKVPVSSKNWKDYAVGEAGEDVLRDGEFIRVPMMLRDAKMVNKVKSGKVQLSVGYACDIDWTPGLTHDGQAYDGRQTDIQVNHIAIVDQARGGDKLSIGDDDDTNGNTNKERKHMKTMTVDGITCEMSDTAIEVVSRTINNLRADAEKVAKKFGESEEDYQKRLKEMGDSVAKLTTDLASATTKVTTLEAQLKDAVLTPDKLDQMVKDRQTISDKAKALLTTVAVDGKTIDEIMKQVVDARIGDAAKAWDASQIKVSFDTLTAGVVPVKDHSGFDRQRQSFSVAPANVQDTSKLYDNYDKKLADAWKTPA